MKQDLLFWPSLFGAFSFFNDDFFGKDDLKVNANLNDSLSRDENGYSFNFLPGIDIDPNSVEITVENGQLNVKYDKVKDGEEFHYATSRTLPEDADVETFEASTDGTGLTVTVKLLPPKEEEPKKVANIPVKVTKPKE